MSFPPSLWCFLAENWKNFKVGLTKNNTRLKENFEKKRFHLFKRQLYQNGKAEKFPVLAGRSVFIINRKFFSTTWRWKLGKINFKQMSQIKTGRIACQLWRIFLYWSKNQATAFIGDVTRVSRWSTPQTSSTEKNVLQNKREQNHKRCLAIAKLDKLSTKSRWKTKQLPQDTFTQSCCFFSEKKKN